ncbi:MAG: methylenetetrahydrofolate reductase [NAD(P)H] [Butyrivibrio sp.]|nr:methylenetetrahydrofolate reductase [NAD(P)H] [Butyrivibrio sp.]
MPIINKHGKNIELSCEVFPPKKDLSISGIYETLDSIKSLDPDFISVTYGAGGSNSKKTAEIASYIQNSCNINALAHLTAVGVTPQKLNDLLTEYKANGIKRILALRGDKPRDMSDEDFENRHYKYAGDIVKEIFEFGGFHIYGACYPEKHPEAATLEEDIKHIKEKVDLGVSGLITQMFFDNEKLYSYIDKLDKAGIHVAIHAGIMPITAPNQLGTSVSLSGSSIPTALSNLIAEHADDPEGMKKAGVEYAIKQVEDLIAHGIDGIHLYSMNKADITKQIFEAVI